MAVLGAQPAGETTDLAALLAACTVRLAGEGMAGGAAFFVAPGWVVTCAHVVEGRRGEQIRVHWGTVEATGQVVTQHPERRPENSATYPFPDLALIQVSGVAGHGCVWLEDAIPVLEARLHTYGFTKTWSPTEPGGEPASFTFEGLQEVEGGRLLKFSAGEAVPGMSGGPLLDLGSGRVCGVVKTTRDAHGPRGGWAIPVMELRERHPEVWAAHDEFHARDGRWRSLAEGWVQLAELLLEPPPLRSDREGPSALLRPDFQVVGFHGRAELLDQLEGWCLDPGGFGLRLVTGPGGQGKSRLAHQLCVRMTAHGWLAGPLQRGELSELALGRLQATSVACLLVVDYAETRTGQLGRLVDGQAGRVRVGPVRLLLLARSAGDWWADFGRASPRRRSIVDGVIEAELPPLDDTLQGRQQAYAEALAAFARELDRDPPLRSAPALVDPTYGLVLNLHMAALAAVLEAGDDGDGQLDGSGDPVARVLDHEQRYWHDSAEAAGLGGLYEQVDLDRAVAAATLCGAQDEAQAVALLGRIPNLPAPDRAIGLARLLRRLYPSRSSYWAPLQPDLLGEELIAQVTGNPVVAGGPAGFLAALVTNASDNQIDRALTVLARAAPRHGHLSTALGPLLQTDPQRLMPPSVTVAIQARDPSPVAAALRETLGLVADSQLILPLLERLPESTVALAEFAVEVTQQGLDHYRAQADPAPAMIAWFLVSLVLRLRQVGRREDALAASEEAVGLYRQLAADAPDAFLPNLANSLNNLATMLGDVGRREDALAASEEAVELYRQLAEATPDTFLPGLAGSLTTLSGHLGMVGRREDALAAGEEAVELYRQLAADAPDAFLPSLANSLNTLSAELIGIGRREDALAVIEEAVELYRQLAADAPDAFLPNLAMSLNNLANRLSDIGRREDALAAGEEAVELYLQLAKAIPDAFLPELANALNGLSNRFGAVGRREDALQAVEAAVELWRPLATDAPEAFLPDLARSLSNASGRLGELGRVDEALAVNEEAVDLYRQLAAAQPSAFLPDLAGSLNNLSIWLDTTSQPGEALVASEEAVELCRQLASEAPDAFLPNLAHTIRTLSSRLSAAERWEDALAASEEATGLYRQLAEAAPEAFLPDLGESLVDLSSRLIEVGYLEDSLAAIQEATAIFRQLAASEPDAFLPDLASSLNDLSVRLSQTGLQDDALAVNEEAVELIRPLAVAEPDVFLPVLAGSLNNLSARLSEMGRGDEALTAIQEAVDSYRQLVAVAPHVFIPNLAGALDLLAQTLIGLGREEEAQKVTAEADNLFTTKGDHASQ